MAAHRYWRILVTANTGDATYLELNELFFYDAQGNDLAAGVTPAGFAGTSTGPDSNMFDRAASYWYATIATPPAAGCDFGAAVEPHLVGITNGSKATRAPQDFTVQHSDDGVVWADQDAVIGETGWAAGEKRVFEMAAYVPATSEKAERYRVRIKDTQDSAETYCLVAEMDLLDVGGASLIVGGTVIGDPPSGGVGTELDKAFDDNNLTYWAGLMSTTGYPWLGYNFGAKKLPYKLMLTFPAEGATPASTAWLPRAPKDFVVEFSNDGLLWTKLKEFTAEPAWARGEVREYVLPVPGWTPPKDAIFSRPGAKAATAPVPPAGTVPAAHVATAPIPAPGSVPARRVATAPVPAPGTVPAIRVADLGAPGGGMFWHPGASVVVPPAEGSAVPAPGAGVFWLEDGERKA